MTAVFSIEVDRARHLVSIILSGFFAQPDVDRFAAARVLAHERLRCGPNQHLTIVDITQMKVQAQTMVAAFGAIIADPALRSRRLAFVVGRTLARHQLVRALGVRDARCFESQAEAETWLLAPDHARAA